MKRNKYVNGKVKVTGMSESKSVHAWLNVLAGFLLIGTSVGMYYNCTTVFVDSVTADLYFSRAEFVATTSIMLLLSLPTALLVAKALKHFSIQIVIFCCGLFCSLSIFAYSFASQLWHFYFLAGVVGFFYPGIQYLVVNSVISEWFDKRRGLALGLAASGAGVLGAVAVPILTAVLQRYSWRTGYRIMGIMGFVFCTMAVFLLNEKHKPVIEDVETDSTPQAQDEKPSSKGITVQEAIRTRQFYLLCFGLFGISVVCTGIQPHIIPYLMDNGYDMNLASVIMSSFLLLLLPAKTIIGMLFDTFGSRRSIFFIGGVLILSLIALMGIRISWIVPWLFAMVYSFGYSAMSIGTPYLTGDLFGYRDYSSILAWTMIASTGGGSLGSIVSGIIYDSSGSYGWAWILFIGLSILLTVSLLRAVQSADDKKASLEKNKTREGESLC